MSNMVVVGEIANPLESSSNPVVPSWSASDTENEQNPPSDVSSGSVVEQLETWKI